MKRKASGRKQFDGKSQDIILQKLEQAFALGCTDAEAYFYAEISKTAFYDFQKNNPEFLDRKEVLRAGVILKARKTIIDSISRDVKSAQWYLEKKCPEEFGDKAQNSQMDQHFHFARDPDDSSGREINTDLPIKNTQT